MNPDRDVKDSKTDNKENQGKLFLLMWGRGKVGVITRV